MNFATRFLTTAVIGASTIFGAVAPVQAGLQDMSCGQLQTAGSWCGEYLGSFKGGQAYRIEYTNPAYNEKEEMTVVCDRRNVIDWESYGNLTTDQANWVAEEFCALPG